MQPGHQVLEHRPAPGEQADPAGGLDERPAELEPVPARGLAPGDRQEARQARLRGQQVVAGGVEPALRRGCSRSRRGGGPPCRGTGSPSPRPAPRPASAEPAAAAPSRSAAVDARTAVGDRPEPVGGRRRRPSAASSASSPAVGDAAATVGVEGRPDAAQRGRRRRPPAAAAADFQRSGASQGAIAVELGAAVADLRERAAGPRLPGRPSRPRRRARARMRPIRPTAAQSSRPSQSSQASRSPGASSSVGGSPAGPPRARDRAAVGRQRRPSVVGQDAQRVGQARGADGPRIGSSAFSFSPCLSATRQPSRLPLSTVET